MGPLKRLRALRARRQPRPARAPLARDAAVADVVRVNGTLCTVVRVTWPGGLVALEPLADRLARTMIVNDAGVAVAMTLADALQEAGWRRPAHDYR